MIVLHTYTKSSLGYVFVCAIIHDANSINYTYTQVIVCVVGFSKVSLSE